MSAPGGPLSFSPYGLLYKIAEQKETKTKTEEKKSIKLIWVLCKIYNYEIENILFG